MWLLLLLAAGTAGALDESEWPMMGDSLPPKERVALVEKTLATYDRASCSLLLGAFLSGDQELDLLLPAVQQQLHLLVLPEDADYLAARIEKTENPRLQDAVLDLLGFCGEPGFARLRQLREQSQDLRLRLGALRAMQHLLVPAAVAYVADVAAKATTPVERDLARLAEARLRWGTGQMLPGAVPLRGRPWARLSDGPEALRKALAAGATLLIRYPDLNEGAIATLKDLGVTAPQQGEKLAFQSTFFSVTDFHPLVAYPYDFFYASVAAGTCAQYSWAKWAPGQLAPLRPREAFARAALVIQEGVQGQGRVVFSGLAVPSWEDAAKHGKDERDPWEENLEWYHANRDPGGFLHIWQVTDGCPTPVVPWGKPLTGGPLRAAILTPDYNGRDVVDVTARLDLTAEHLPYSWAPKKAEAFATQPGRLTPFSWTVIERLLATPRDVVIMGGRSQPPKVGPETFSQLPVDYQQTVLRLVRDRGLGLVIIGEDGPLPKLPAETPRTKVAGPLVPTTRVTWGKGRIVCLGRLTQPPPSYQVPGAFHSIVRVNPYDYWMAEVASHVAWAAGREPPLQFPGSPAVVAAGVQVPIKNVGAQPLTGTLTVALRNLFGRVAGEGQAPLDLAPGKEARLAVPVTGLYAGAFFAEVIGRDAEGRSLGWAAVPLTAAGPVRLTNLEFDRPEYRPGDEVVIKLVTDGQLPAGARIAARLLDQYGRVCGQATAPADAAPPTCRLPIGRPLWRYAYVQVDLLGGEQRLAHCERPVIVDVPPPAKDFPYMAWSDLPQLPPLTGAAHLAGIDWLNADFERCLLNGLRPWVLGFGGLGLGEHAAAMNYERNPSTLGPTFHQWRLNEIPPQVPNLKRAGVAAIIDQDEEGLGGEYDFHPAALREFRKYLQVVHGTLAELNRVWQTTYKDWAEVTPLRVAQLQGRASLAPMVEHRMFMDTAYLHHCEFDRFVIESYGLPDVKLGLSTSGGGFADGWDIWKAANMLTCMIEQHTGNREKFRSWARPDMVLGRWTGGYYPDCVTSGRFLPWHELLHQKTAYATWEGGLGSDMSIWRPGGTSRDGIAAAAQELREIWGGPATIIRHSQRVPPPIGLHYSRASQMTSVVDWGGATWEAMDAYESGFEALGHEFRYISYEELEQGFTDTWPGQCLFLPLSTCLSPAEAAALRRFVERGGTLIADCDPGTRDGFGGAPGPGQLADVFGCEWTAPPAMTAVPGQLTLQFEAPGVPAPVETSHGYSRVVKLTTGKALGKVQCGGVQFPAWIVQEFGKGKAITLNFLPFRTKAGWGLLRALLKSAGVTIPVGVRKDGADLMMTERFSFTDGPLRYTGLINFVKQRSGWGQLYLSAEEQRPVPGVTLTFPAKTHLYNVRTKEYLGETNEVTLELNPGRGYLFAHLPYRVTAVALELPAASVKAPAVIGLRIVAGPAPIGAHTIRVQVTDPTGRERPEYSGVRYYPGGTGQYEVPLAPNDPPGQWRVVATDSASGVAVTQPWEVKP